MSSEILLSNITVGLRGKPIRECEVALECNNQNYRLYVDRHQEDNSFYAAAVEFASCEISKDDMWDCPSLEVTPLFNVIAYFDGVRHLDFCGDYTYCPSIVGLTELLSKVREIELEICPDCD